MVSNKATSAKKLRKKSTDTERLLWRYPRTKQIEEIKFSKVLGFWNHDVLTNIEGVLEVTRQNCLQPGSPSPTPPIKGGAT